MLFCPQGRCFAKLIRYMYRNKAKGIIYHRRTGIASELLCELFEMEKRNDSIFYSVDFESQNIEGRKFWLRYFTPIVYSMMRKIDDRIDL